MVERDPPAYNSAITPTGNHAAPKENPIGRYLATIYRSIGFELPHLNPDDSTPLPSLFGTSARLLATYQLAIDSSMTPPASLLSFAPKAGSPMTPAQAAAPRPRLLLMNPTNYVRYSSMNTFLELLAYLLGFVELVPPRASDEHSPQQKQQQQLQQRAAYPASEGLNDILKTQNSAARLIQVLYGYCLNPATLAPVIEISKVRF